MGRTLRAGPEPPFVRFGPPSTTLFRGAHVVVGTFRCPRDHPNFRHEGEIAGCEIVFPRSAVWILRPDRRPFVADPSRITLYNRGQCYERAALCPEGDNADWFAVDEPTAREIVGTFDRRSAEAANGPLPFACLPSTPALYLRQRRILRRLSTDALDRLEIEEEVLRLWTDALRSGFDSDSREESTVDREPVRRAQELLAARYAEKLSLDEIASSCGLSSFRLAHLFRAATGSPMHAHRLRLRLLAALNALEDSPGRDLTELALELGFSSHGHLTTSFRRCFGLTPSAARAGRSIRRRARARLAATTRSGPEAAG